jgi:thymidylate synthase
MITGGPPGAENQLDFILAAYKNRSGTRRSILQVAIFQPSLDHSNAALLGFPCLQHVTFAPTSDGLNVNAFYAVQYIAERAYGNYLGLCRLGRFVAHVLGLSLATVTCVAGIAELDIGKREARSLLKQMELEAQDEPK